MTKTTFKKKWDKEDSDITFDDIAQCAIEWGFTKVLKPKGLTLLQML